MPLVLMLVSLAFTFVAMWHVEGGGYRALATAAIIGISSVVLWTCTVSTTGIAWVP